MGVSFLFYNSLTNCMQRLVSERGYIEKEYSLPKRIIDRINMYKTFEQQKFHRENDKEKIPQNVEVLPEPLDSVYDENNEYNKNNNSDYENSNYPMNTNTDEDVLSDVFPHFQRPSLGNNNDFDNNFGEIQREL